MRTSPPPQHDLPNKLKIGIAVLLSTFVLAMLAVQLVVSVLVLAVVLMR